MTIVLLLVVVAAVVTIVLAGLANRQQDPMLEIARAKARHAMQAELFEQRSKIRAAEADWAAREEMAGRRGGNGP